MPLLIAVLGLLGGYCTPVMLSTGQKNFVGLFSYMLVLGVGLLGIAKHKNWKLLNGLSFLATYVLFVGSLEKFYDGSADYPAVMAFLAAFFRDVLAPPPFLQRVSECEGDGA